MIEYIMIGFFSAISLGSILLNNTFTIHNKRIHEMLKHNLESLNNDIESNNNIEKDIKENIKNVYELSKLII